MVTVSAVVGGISAGASPVPAQQNDVVGTLRPDSLLMQTAGRARFRLSEYTDDLHASGGTGTLDSAPSTRWLLPAARIAWNSDIPFGGNDGAMWAGRGATIGVSGGVSGRIENGSLTFAATVIPTFTYSANRPFEVFPSLDPARAGHASPWHAGRASADLPLRPGVRGFGHLSLGESYLEVSTRRVRGGIGSRSRWWGPGVRNALVLGNNAPPLPQLFLETARPAHTRVGTISGTLLWGALTESRYFDFDSDNDMRPVSGLLLEWRPSFEPHLALGISRLVTRPADRGGPGNALDAIVRWEAPAADSDTLDDGRLAQQTDQLTSLFARWVFPASGFEVYGEWARSELPGSLRELVLATHSSQAYTLGTQWAVRAPRPGDRVKLHLEVTNLEQSVVEGHLPGPFYTGRASAHGFTHRGQVLGAAIGPGSSSQYLGVDYMTTGWEAGVFAGRTRWENDVMYRQNFPNFYKHDVSIYAGMRGAAQLPGVEVTGELLVGRRMNYLFQTSFGNAGGYRDVDIRNVTLSFGLVPRLEFRSSPPSAP